MCIRDRYLFSECFAVIAFAEFSKAAQDEAAKAKALEVYELILKYHSTEGLLEPKVLPASGRSMAGLAMPMILINITQVLRDTGCADYSERVIDPQIKQVVECHMKADMKVVLESVPADGGFLDEPQGREVNPGHSIEVAWFLLAEAKHRGDTQLQEQALTILDWNLDIGWDEEYGGIFYFRDAKGLPCPQYEHDMKLWWPHNETIFACLLAYQMTQAPKYLAWYVKVKDWAYAHFPDSEHGEWFGYLHRDGSLSSSLKGNMWKGPFHLPRMQLFCLQLVREMQQTKEQ
eukprot:TRINITY_DN7128_c0_g1_i1.p2 TRINITY_DN7128_c0_g1~~TRINITY_DN7128_c0_g1_i1.p2  ORF type:complete len:289 (-),score=99.31 TRINITY_DN7128_c0_g1_i1:194-1060(-)